MYKLYLFLFFLILLPITLYGQSEQRIQTIQNRLELLAIENKGLTENLKLDINVNNVSLSNFLLAISQVHKININIDPNLQNITIVNNFSDVTVADLLVFLCKKYELDINFSGNILSIGKFIKPPEIIPEKEINVSFDPLNNLISLDLQADPLEKVFRKIIDESGRNLLFNPGMEKIPIQLYLRQVPFDAAMEKLAETNNMTVSKSRDGFFLFDKILISNDNGSNNPSRNKQFDYHVVDTLRRIVTVDFNNTPIPDIIGSITEELDIDYYIATPLDKAGNVSFKASEIYFDDLLDKIFEAKQYTTPFSNNIGRYTNNTPSNNTPSNNSNKYSVDDLAFTYKKENDIYFFGTYDQLSVRKFEVIQMMHRSVELLGDPSPYTGRVRTAGRTISGGVNYLGNGSVNSNGFNNPIRNQNLNTQQNYNSQRVNNRRNDFENYLNQAEAIVNILPDEIIADLDIKIDFELNSFLVSGPAQNINRFKKFITKIDKPVPVVLIEVMLLEVRKTATVETGISWGIGDEEIQTKGAIFPEANLTLGANTVNKIIGGFDGFGSFNIGKVVPEFFATIKAMEANGNIKIKSTPKLSTLNGHRANLSIGETTYYVITSQNFFGSQIPTTSEVRNFQPIDAELAVSIKPLVSGNGQVTLDINVVQSDFSGDRIDEDAPPGITSREFSSIIRMQDQDLAILGGLEEKVKNDSGNGVPFLARIPIIKWLFSSRKREDSKHKLTILIKPTVIY